MEEDKIREKVVQNGATCEKKGETIQGRIQD